MVSLLFFPHSFNTQNTTYAKVQVVTCTIAPLFVILARLTNNPRSKLKTGIVIVTCTEMTMNARAVSIHNDSVCSTKNNPLALSRSTRLG